MKIFWIGLAIVTLLLGVAVSFPGVRNGIDHAFPGLGINGKASRPGEPDRGLAVKPEPSVSEQPTETPLPVPSNSGDAHEAEGTSYASHQLKTIDAPPASHSGADIALLGDTTNSNSSQPEVRLAQGGLPTPTSQPLGFPPVGSAPAAVPSLVPTYPQSPTSLPAPTTPQGELIVERASVDFVRMIDVAAQSDGIIMELYVDEGKHISEGDKLLELDSRIANAEVLVQSRELEQATLKANNEEQIKFAEAAFDVAKELANISDVLYKQNAENYSQNKTKQLDKKKSEVQIKLAMIEHEIDKAAVEVSKAKLEAANVQIALRTITAPWNGFVSRVMKQRYSYVRAGEIVFSLIDLSKIRIKGPVRINGYANLILNAKARVVIEIAPGKSIELDAKVGNVSYETIEPNSYMVWVEIENQRLPDGQYQFRKGMAAKIYITPRSE